MGIVSIIVPVYNGGAYLDKTIKQLLKSEYEDIEIILLDDGSKDDSLYICEKNSRNDKRVKVFHHDNIGIAQTRNKGISLSTGKYICFCDQDDLIDTSMYEKLYKRIENDKSDIAICGTKKIIGDDLQEFEKFNDAILDKKDIKNKLVYSILFDGYNGYEGLDEGRIGNSIWKCMVKRDLLIKNDIEFRKFIDYEDDRTFLLEILSCACRVSLLSECLYFWRINLKSETYRRKYIINMKEKMQKYSLYEQKILTRLDIPPHILNQYFKIEFGDMNGRTLKEKKRFLKQEVCSWMINDCSIFRKKLKHKLIKKKVILFLLAHNWGLGAYLFDVFYQKIRRIGLRCTAWTKIEQRASVKK